MRAIAAMFAIPAGFSWCSSCCVGGANANDAAAMAVASETVETHDAKTDAGTVATCSCSLAGAATTNFDFLFALLTSIHRE